MPNCDVRGCGADSISEVIERAGIHYRLCEDHSLVVRAGEHIAFHPKTREIVIGSAAPLSVINLRTKLERGNPNQMVILELGRDGVTQQKLLFQVTDEQREWFRSL
jgi:hypothetical protein